MILTLWPLSQVQSFEYAQRRSRVGTALPYPVSFADPGVCRHKMVVISYHSVLGWFVKTTLQVFFLPQSSRSVGFSWTSLHVGSLPSVWDHFHSCGHCLGDLTHTHGFKYHIDDPKFVTTGSPLPELLITVFLVIWHPYLDRWKVAINLHKPNILSDNPFKWKHHSSLLIEKSDVSLHESVYLFLLDYLRNTSY